MSALNPRPSAVPPPQQLRSPNCRCDACGLLSQCIFRCPHLQLANWVKPTGAHSTYPATDAAPVRTRSTNKNRTSKKTCATSPSPIRRHPPTCSVALRRVPFSLLHVQSRTRPTIYAPFASTLAFLLFAPLVVEAYGAFGEATRVAPSPLPRSPWLRTLSAVLLALPCPGSWLGSPSLFRSAMLWRFSGSLPSALHACCSPCACVSPSPSAALPICVFSSF